MNNFERDFALFSRSNGVPSTMLEGYQKFMNNYLEPTIIEERQLNATQISVFSRLFMERILWIGGEINSDVANIVNSQLLFLQTNNPDKPITMYINSPGGSVYDGMAIYDTMQIITPKVATTCCGTAASMGAVLLSSGSKGMRSALPHSQIMLHAPSGGTGRITAPDMRIVAKEMEKCEEMLYRVLADNMDKDYEYVKTICDRDYWLTPEEALNENVIDKIIKKK